MNDTWDALSDIYEFIKGELLGFDMISPADLEQYRYHELTYHYVQSDLLEKLKLGKSLHVATVEAEERSVLMPLAYELSGGSIGGNRIPTHVTEDLDRGTSDRAAIEAAITNRQLTNDFVLAWTRACTLFGALEATRHLKLDRQTLKGFKDAASSGLEIQGHWFARWVEANGPKNVPKKTAKELAGQKLAAVCNRIARGGLKAWGNYPVEWYARALNTDKDDLSDSFYNISNSDLAAMREHKIVTKDVLPPLRTDGFVTVVK